MFYKLSGPFCIGIIAMTLFIPLVQGQEKSPQKTMSGFGIQASVVRFNNLKVESKTGNVLFSSKPSDGNIWEFCYSRTIHRGFTLKASAGFGFLNYAFESIYDPEKNTPLMDSLIANGYNPDSQISLVSNKRALVSVGNLSLMVGKEFELSKRSTFQFCGGIQCMFNLDNAQNAFYSKSFPQKTITMQPFEDDLARSCYKVRYPKPGKPLLNLLIDIGYYYQLKSDNKIGLSVVYNNGFSNLAHGSYNVLPDRNLGSVSTSLGTSYFGFKFSYITLF